MSRGPAPKLDRGPARQYGEARCGFFRVRVGRMQWAPASISRPCHCTVNGGDDCARHEWRDGCDRWPPLVGEIDGLMVDPLEDIWHSGKSVEIDALEHAALVMVRAMEANDDAV